MTFPAASVPAALETGTWDAANPFASPSTLPYGLPDFAAIHEEHYLPAFLAGMAQERAEIEEILGNPEPATIDNTLVALERSGEVLARTAAVFFNQAGADSTPGLDAIEEQVAPLLAAHHDAIELDPRLLDRLTDLQHAVDDGLAVDADTAWLLRTMIRDVVRAGTGLPAEAQERVRELNQAISTREAAFGRTLLAATNDAAVLVEDAGRLAGLAADTVAAAAHSASTRGHAGAYLIELHLPTQQPVLAQLRDRELREQIHRASVSRGDAATAAASVTHDTRGILLDLVRLRAERAQLLGFPHHAALVAEEGTAQTTDAVMSMLTTVVQPAVANARLEHQDRAAAMALALPGAAFAAWDWAYYAEQVRRDRFRIDDAQLRPYLELDRVLRDGVFRAAGDLYGLEFAERPDLTGYHPDVRVFEVTDGGGAGVGLFLADLYTRDSKRGGAWMDSLVDQSTLLEARPVVVNNLNIAKPPAGEATLLTWDEVITLFHEFGHSLHALLSDVRYPSQSGTNVPRDFVEFPSQVNEMWAWDPELLASYAVHHATGEVIPGGLVEAVAAARQFDEGHATTEYLGAVLLDQAWHQLAPDDVPASPDQVEAFEADALARAGVALPSVPPRYRSTYFNHVFGGGYAAAYYSYLWSEILDADTVAWFADHGGRTRANGEAFRRAVLSRGDSGDPMVAVRALLGRDPDIEPLLVRRGLTRATVDEDQPLP